MKKDAQKTGMFRLRFPESDIARWAVRYSYASDQHIEKEIAPAARERGYLNRGEFLDICRWKTPRIKSRCATNREEFIQEVTRIALSTQDEELKIRILLLLSGVQWPVASVLLHFCDRGRYPIIDFRALWSLGINSPPPYDFVFWKEYCFFIRSLADRTNNDMRTVDRALWQYSKENQGRGGS